MSENDAESTKIEVACAFITEKRHDVARAILETMPDSEQAQSWLGTLQKKPAQATQANPQMVGGIWLPVLMIVVGLFAGIVAGLLLATDVNELGGSQLDNLNATIEAQNATIEAFVVMPITDADESTPEFTATREPDSEGE